MSQDDLVSLGIAAVHVGIAAALWFGLPGARLATLVAFAVHWLHFGYVWLVALFVVLGGPGLGSGGVNPVLLGALAAVAVGVALIYGTAIRSMLVSDRVGDPGASVRA